MGGFHDLERGGSNGSGQLGDGTTTNHPAPTPVSGGHTNWVAVSAGGLHTCARRNSGELYCWGDNNSGQLGDGTQANRPIPTLISPPFGTSWVNVSAGAVHTCAANSRNELYCWGLDVFGQLGDGTTTDRTRWYIEANFTDGTGLITVSAGALHTCAFRSVGRLNCWGGKLRRSAWGWDDDESYLPCTRCE
jgi:alpha-tubulin suppressor-like RCC1 family protein